MKRFKLLIYDLLYKKYYATNEKKRVKYENLINKLGLRLLSDYSGLNPLRKKAEVIVSLTTISDRINKVEIPIICMMAQTIKPDIIILWLDIEKYNDSLLPKNLQALKEKGLRIEYVKDVGPHTKYHYAMQRYPDAKIITIDDDVFYKRNMIEGLLKTAIKYPGCICANWVWKMRFTQNGIPYPFERFNLGQGNYEFEPSHSLMALGVGGVLYPQHSLDDRTFDLNTIRKLSYLQDDVWLKAMEIISGKKVVKVSGRYLKDIQIKESQTKALRYENHNGGNNRYIKQVFQYFNLIEKFKGIHPYNGEYLDKYWNMFLIAEQWLLLKQNGINIEQYLKAKGIHSIAIYGMNHIGKLLLNELKNSLVQVKYGIDKNASELSSDIPVYTMNQIPESIDLIIVTAIADYKTIKNDLAKYITCNTMLFEDLLIEMQWELVE